MNDVPNVFRSDAPFRHQFDVARDPYAARNALGIDSVLANYLTTATAATTYATVTNFPATAWVTWSPTITAGSGTITSTTVTRAKYIQLGKTVTAQIDVTITNAGSGAGAFIFSVPVTGISGSLAFAAGREQALTGNALTGNLLTTTTCGMSTYNNLTPIATNSRILAQIVYEAA